MRDPQLVDYCGQTRDNVYSVNQQVAVPGVCGCNFTLHKHRHCNLFLCYNDGGVVQKIVKVFYSNSLVILLCNHVKVQVECLAHLLKCTAERTVGINHNQESQTNLKKEDLHEETGKIRQLSALGALKSHKLCHTAPCFKEVQVPISIGDTPRRLAFNEDNTMQCGNRPRVQ